MWPFKKSHNHDWEVIESKDIYDTNVFNNPLGQLAWTYTYPAKQHFTLSMTKELEGLFKEKGISKDLLLKKCIEIFVQQKNEEVEKIKKEHEKQMKVKAHYVLMKCKTCGKIYEHTEFFDPLDRFREQHSCGHFFL